MRFELRTNSNGTEAGIFATEFIREGEIICIFEGESVPVYSTFQFGVRPKQLLQVGEKEFVSISSDLKFMKHSCEPNAYFKEKQILYAWKDILPGKEITYDYSFNDNFNFSFKCACGSKSCRKQITPYKDLTEKEKQDNWGLTTDYLKK